MNGNLSRLNFSLLGVFIIVLLTVGCSSIPVGKFDVLAESSQGILNCTSETYTRIEKLQRNYVVERVPNAPLSRDTFHPVTIVNGQIESFDLTPELDFREDALQVLVNYTLVLQAFAKRDFEGDVDKAAADFAGSVKSLAATAAPNNGNAQKASKEVPLAHADIRTMLDGKPKNLDALAQLVKDAQRINKLYRSLK